MVEVNRLADLVDYHELGMSLLEMSHRGPVFEPIIEQTRQLALSLWDAPDDFDVLFMQGGASGQFPIVPMNLLNKNNRGAYINTGHWVNTALNDAQFSGQIYTAWSGKDEAFSRTPDTREIKLKEHTRYVHLCCNAATYSSIADAGDDQAYAHDVKPKASSGVPLFSHDNQVAIWRRDTPAERLWRMPPQPLGLPPFLPDPQSGRLHDEPVDGETDLLSG